MGCSGAKGHVTGSWPPSSGGAVANGRHKRGRCAGTPLSSEEVKLRVTLGTAGQELAWARSARV